MLSAAGGSSFSWTQEQHMRRCGYDQAQIDKASKSNFGFGDIITPVPGAFRRLTEGDVLQVGDTRWRVIMGYGHSPEHACLFSDSLNVLISGDQVIPKITSNISVNGSEPEANPMKGWLHSLERYLEVLPADALVLPAHNAPFHGLHERLRFLIEHHEEHLLALEEACASTPRTAMDLLPVLFKRELTDHHLGLAVGECLAHLNYLHQRGQVSREQNDAGQYFYTACDETLEMRLRKQAHHTDPAVPVQV
jgi:glyoxylase-like metal-dependent hydrolase (beta-lactamase superfamily II)